MCFEEDIKKCLSYLLVIRDFATDSRFSDQIEMFIAKVQSKTIQPLALNKLKAALLELENKVTDKKPRSRNASTSSNGDHGLQNVSLNDPETKDISETPPAKKRKILQSEESFEISSNGNFEFTNQLRPWISENDLKKIDCIEKMLEIKCIKNIFKCMLSFCNFSTNSRKIFFKHLCRHERELPQYRRNFSRCSYCNFVADKPSDLMRHTINMHAFDKYGCRFCFYRSVSKSCVDFHTRYYHKDKKPEILELKIEYHEKQFNYQIAYSNATIYKQRNIQPLGISGQCFYTFESYFKVLKKIPNFQGLMCTKCKKIILLKNFRAHANQCVGIFHFHCIYCNFGSSVSHHVRLHLVDKHATMMPFFCQRVQLQGSDYSSIDCLPLINL